jgi:large subunit ribosomal protein L25
MAIDIKLQLRTITGKKVKLLRNEGILPATVYGKGMEPISVQINAREFAPQFKTAGRSTDVTLHIDGHQPMTANIHSFQRHPVSRVVIHVDFVVKS